MAREINLQKVARKKLGLNQTKTVKQKMKPNQDGPMKPVPYDPYRKKTMHKIDKSKFPGVRTELAKRKLQKEGIPRSYWDDQEKRAQSFTDTSGMNREKPKAEDDSNAIYYDKLTKRRKTIPGRDAKPTDIQVSYPSYP